MRWQGGRRSTNVQDRRGMRVGLAGGGIGAVVLTILALILGVDPGEITQETQPAEAPGPGANDPEKEFASVVLGYTEDTWNAIFARAGEDYQEPQLVVFSDAVQSACGMASSAVGPFYCPMDQTVYLDLTFFRELRDRFGAAGDFAAAYVIAHEVGHHVQTLTGVTQQVQDARARTSTERANQLSVRTELQADCYAGVWAQHTEREKRVLEPGDIEEAMNAAAAIGDDRLQRQAQGYVVPESFTHGSSEERVRWVRRGFDSGDVNQCDTFSS
jgi:predicted metalloprotease